MGSGSLAGAILRTCDMSVARWRRPMGILDKVQRRKEEAARLGTSDMLIQVDPEFTQCCYFGATNRARFC